MSVRAHGQRGNPDELAPSDRGARSVDVERDCLLPGAPGQHLVLLGSASPSRPGGRRRVGTEVTRSPSAGGSHSSRDRRSDRSRNAKNSTTPGWTVVRPRSPFISGTCQYHESTIWRILTARGLIVADPSKAPKHSGRSYTAPRANECWALDSWGWSLADGTTVQILDVLDDHSRYAVACTAMPTCTGTAAFKVIAAAAVFLGWPQRFWSDNARAFSPAPWPPP